MKAQRYQTLVNQIASLIEGESDLIAVMSNVAAAIHQEMHFWWTGFYRVVDNELLLWLACISLLDVVSVAPPGSVRRRLWYPMWSSSPGTLPAVAPRARRLSYLCSIVRALSSPCSISTVRSWARSTMSIASIWSKYANSLNNYKL